MSPTRRQFLGAATASTVAGLAGCPGDGGTGAPTDSPAATPTAMPDDAAMATVAVSSHPEHGDVLVDGDGMTLYMFDQNETDPPATACTGGCTTSWPPLTSGRAPEVTEDVAAALETFERPDGSGQVIAGGWPLYYYSSDESPADAAGKGVGEDWWVLEASGTPQRVVGGDGGGGRSGGGGTGAY